MNLRLIKNKMLEISSQVRFKALQSTARNWSKV